MRLDVLPPISPHLLWSCVSRPHTPASFACKSSLVCNGTSKYTRSHWGFLTAPCTDFTSICEVACHVVKVADSLSSSTSTHKIESQLTMPPEPHSSPPHHSINQWSWNLLISAPTLTLTLSLFSEPLSSTTYPHHVLWAIWTHQILCLGNWSYSTHTVSISTSLNSRSISTSQPKSHTLSTTCYYWIGKPCWSLSLYSHLLPCTAPWRWIPCTHCFQRFSAGWILLCRSVPLRSKTTSSHSSEPSLSLHCSTTSRKSRLFSSLSTDYFAVRRRNQTGFDTRVEPTSRVECRGRSDIWESGENSNS